MRTVSLGIENLCAPCHAACRHCLLSSDGRATGVPYARGQAFAARMLDWARAARPELSVMFYVGYAMDFPELLEYIRFTRAYAPERDFLQGNGLALRAEEEAETFLSSLYEAGIRHMDFTFYGTGAAHDRFAGRAGDYEYLLRLLRAANACGLGAQASVALTRENAAQMPALFDALGRFALERVYVFLPHAKGRGAALSDARLTRADFDALCPEAKAAFSRVPHRTEAEWLARGAFPEAEARAVTLALTPENIGRAEAMAPEEILRELENMDDAYHAAMPGMGELAARCGRADNEQLFRLRDLYLQWQKRWLAAHPSGARDMQDERRSFSARLYPEG